MAPIASALTRVLITGFGPFQGAPINPSWSIASQLPQTHPSDPSISLLVHPSPVPVAFHPTISLLPSLYTDATPDIALHIGLASGRTYFAVEQSSQKTGYQWATDIDGRNFSVAEQNAAWPDLPAKLSTSLDLNATVARWKTLTSDLKFTADGFNAQDEESVDVRFSDELIPEMDAFTTLGSGGEEGDVFTDQEDVRWSDAVGTYLCGFIYYGGMGEMMKRKVDSNQGGNGPRNVVFLHVPDLRTEERVKTGVEVTLKLVEALVGVWREGQGLA